jgi:hypothetical protein
MAWNVARTDRRNQNYTVRLSPSLDYVLFTYGNNDAGPGSLDQALQPARVIEVWDLQRYGVAACLAHVMSECEPNEWGLT